MSIRFDRDGHVAYFNQTMQGINHEKHAVQTVEQRVRIPLRACLLLLALSFTVQLHETTEEA